MNQKGDYTVKKLLISALADDHAMDTIDAARIAADGRIDPEEIPDALALLHKYGHYQDELEYAEASHKVARQAECLGGDHIPDRNLAPVLAEIRDRRAQRTGHKNNGSQSGRVIRSR